MKTDTDSKADGERSAETRSKLLAAAEMLVVEGGLTGLSVRKVGERAGMNPALVTYHFGGIGPLLETLCALNLDPMLEAWEGLEAAADGGLDAILSDWLLPLQGCAAFSPGGRALIVLDEIASHGDGAIRSHVLGAMEHFSHRLRAVLEPCCPHLDPDELRARLRFVSAAVLGPPPRAHGAPQGEEGMVLDHPDYLLRFARAVFSA